MEEESEVEFTETVGVDSNIVTGAVASGEGDTVVAGAAVVNLLLIFCCRTLLDWE